MAPPEFDPQKAIALVAVGTALTIVLFRRVRAIASKTESDPWSQEVDLAVRDRGAIPVCTNCLHPQEGHRWLCPHCAFPSGEYVTTMPYLYVFAMGELFRRGVVGPPGTKLTHQAAFVFSAVCEYGPFAPIYWFWLMRRACGKPICVENRVELKFEEPPP